MASRTVCVLLLLIMLNVGIANQLALAAEPWLVVIEGELSRSSVQYLDEIVQRAAIRLPPDSSEQKWLTTIDRRIKTGTGWDFSDFGGQPLTGRIWDWHEERVSRRCRFWRTSDEKIYQHLVSILLAERGGKGDLVHSGSAGEYRIRCSEAVQKGGVSVNWQDVFVGQRNGVMTLGSTSISEVDLTDIAELADMHSRSTNFVRCRPSAIPVAFADAFISQMNQVASVRMQRHDGEAEFLHAIRVARGYCILEAVRMAFHDIEMIEGSSEWNTEESGKCRFSAKLASKEGSALSVLLQDLPISGTVAEFEDNDWRIAYGTVNLGLPSVATEWFSSIKRLWPTETARFNSSVEHILAQRQLCAVFGFDMIDMQTLLQGIAGPPHAVANFDTEQIPSTPREGLLLKPVGVFAVPGIPYVQTQSHELQVAAVSDDSVMGFAATHGKLPSSLTVPQKSVQFQDRSVAVMHLHCDLSRFITTTGEKRDFRQLHELEKLVHHGVLIYRLRGFLKAGNVSAINDPDFVPVAEVLWKDGGDWTLDLNLRVVGSSIVIDGSVGADLHKFLLLRLLLSTEKCHDTKFLRGLTRQRRDPQ